MRPRASAWTAFATALATQTCAPGAPISSTPSPGPAPPYLDTDLPIDERVEDLVSRMTLDEKISQMMNASPAIERLGIPAYDWWSEALHGVARAGRATVFPQAIGLAASWDPDLMLRVATTISDEARAKHHESARKGRHGIYEGLTFFSPNINIFRDPRWGRGMETFGEDPFLTARMAVPFVRGLQGDDPRYLKTVATPKHFAVHSGPEPDRHSFDAIVDERDLRETYLPAFRAAIVEAGAHSVMCAYNRFRGEPCCASDLLLRRILREEWQFQGYVVSDCWAIDDFYRTHKITETAAAASAMAVAAGTDLNCGNEYAHLRAAVAQGLLDERQIDVSLRRLLRARFELGMFDPAERVAYSRIPYRVVDSEAHRQLALEAARKSIVLLKNEGGLLPLEREAGTIAVIGPNADDVEVLLGNYNGLPAEPVTPLEGIRRKVGPRTRVLHARGAELAENTPAFEPVPAAALSSELAGTRVNGLSGEYFNNRELAGSPFATRIDPTIDFSWWEGAPIAGLNADSFGVRWSGTLIPPEPGRYALALRGLGSARLYLGDSLRVEFSDRHVVLTQWREVELTAGRRYPIRVEYFDRRADAFIHLLWSRPEPRLREAAIEAAEQADVVILVLGLSPRLEGEEMPVEVPGFRGGDRVELRLPPPQEELMRAVVELGKPVVLVLLNGSALAVNWAADEVPAILEAWYPGQAAGAALADVLFGSYNPGGRLPITFYRSAEQLPPFEDYRMEGRTYRYFRGDPLFPFGHGLSYTTFHYANLRVPAQIEAGEPLQLSVEVENSGRRAGDEVVQVYLTDLEASVPVPIRALQAFRRLHLRPGEKQEISFTLTPRQLSLIDRSFRRVVEPGRFEVSVGGKQPGLVGVADAPTTQVLTARFEVLGDAVPIPEGR